MKKTYVKPQVYFEDFQLSASIAAGCEVTTTLQTAEGQCGFDDGAHIIFIQGYTGCVYGQDESSSSICYHVPDQNYNLFTSA